MAETSIEDDSHARKLAYLKAYRVEHRDRIKQQAQAKYAANRAKRLADSNNYYKENRDKVLAKRLANYAANPEFIRNEVQKYRDKYAEKIAATKRAKYAVDPSKGRAASKRWAQSHPQQVVALAALYRAKKLSAEGSFTKYDIAKIRKSQKDRCGFCRRKLGGKGHVDHIIALTKGGSNWPNNLQLLCASCNTAKSNRDQIDFARSRGLLL